MTKRKVPRPTDGELEILRVLWKNGPTTVRQVHGVLSRSRDVGYTTVLKLLQVMTEKGLVVRDDSRRSHVYRPRFSETQTQRQLIRDLLAKAFGGCMDKLVMQSLSARTVSPKELAEIRRLVDEFGER